ncbi:MAG: LacI family DNA-binding transcriptional regulator [Acidimicrobiales bacterium]|jgi:LacI family transcriptional regulator
MRGEDGTPTIMDVARLAGVSLATASRSLAGSRRVGEGLRLRVLEAAAALDYSPNLHARALASSEDATIAVIVHDSSDPYFIEILRGMLDRAQVSERIVVVCDTHRDPEREFNYVRHFRRQRVQAILLAGSGFEDRDFGARMTSEIRAFERYGGRVALIGPHNILGDIVMPDNDDGACQMANSLSALGHRRIGIISGPPSLTTTQDRLAGFRRGLSQAGISPSDRLFRVGDFTRDGGEQAMDDLLRSAGDITAVFALNDVMAIGALRALRRRGVKVPDDVSVAGFDDIPIAADVWPPLSTVRVPLVELGVQAVNLALEPQSTGFRLEKLPTSVVLRDSTGPAK